MIDQPRGSFPDMKFHFRWGFYAHSIWGYSTMAQLLLHRQPQSALFVGRRLPALTSPVDLPRHKRAKQWRKKR